MSLASELRESSPLPAPAEPEVSASQLHLERIRQHFDSIAAKYLKFKQKNRYYHRYLMDWCKSVVPPGQKILDLGCGQGDLLGGLSPAMGFGIDLSEKMVALARLKNPAFEFKTSSIEDLAPSQTEFDSALLINVLEYTYDPCKVLAKANHSLRDNGRVLITTANPLWSAIFRVSSALGLRIPDCRRLFLTNLDMRNLLGLNGFEIVYEAQALIFPKLIPLLSPFANWLIPRVPFLRILCSTQLIVGRKVPMKRREYSVSIVIPCYNEAKNIERCMREVPKIGKSTEVIFVNDGSKDETAAAVRPDARSDVQIRLVSYSPNRGKAHAVTTGFNRATGDIVMILDADLTTPGEDLQTVYDAFADGRSEFVNCTRMIYPMDDRAMKVANYIGNKAFTALVSWVIERRVTDTLCGTKALFRRDFPFFRMGRDPWGDYDLLFGAAQLRLAIREIPVHYFERRAGFSKMRSFQHAVKLIRVCARGFLQVKTMHPVRLENRSVPPVSR